MPLTRDERRKIDFTLNNMTAMDTSGGKYVHINRVLNMLNLYMEEEPADVEPSDSDQGSSLRNDVDRA